MDSSMKRKIIDAENDEHELKHAKKKQHSPSEISIKESVASTEGVHDDVQDEAVSAKKHPAVRYFEILSKLRKKKWDKFERLNKKPKTNFKMNNLEAARRRYKKMEVDEEENVSDEEPMETIDYDKLHLAFDQEKSPKFNF